MDEITELKTFVADLDKLDSTQCHFRIRNAAVAWGIWTADETLFRRDPVMFEMKLFGVPAFGSDTRELTRNWRIAAQRLVSEHNMESAA